MKRIVRLALLSVALVAFLAGWFLFEADRRIESKRSALPVELPKLLAEDEPEVVVLLKHPLFAPPDGDDAGRLLNGRLAWADDEVGTLVPAPCREALKRAGTDWQKVGRSEIEGCDTSWLHDLRRFGAWSLASGHRESMGSGPRTEFALPNMLDVQYAAKLHLLLATDSEEAAQDVRHFARLLITQEYLMSSMIGFSVLSIEEKLWELSGKAWSAPPLATAERDFLRRHFFTTMFALNPLAPEALRNSTVDAFSGFRRCMVVTEEAFGRSRSALPAAEGCSFESARWEIAHPYVQTVTERPELLSWPARVGAFIVKRVAPARYSELMSGLEHADYLPADGRWETRQSEFYDRILGPL